MTRAILVLLTMAAIFAAIGSLFGVQGAAYALAASIVIAFWSFWSTPAKLAAIGAVELDDPKLNALVGELAARAGIPPPKLYQIDEPQPNALVLGPNPESAALVITSSLRRRLSRVELGAVIGHELAHIVHRDTLAITIGLTFLNAIATLALLLGVLGLLVGRQGGMMLFLAILAPFAALIVHLTMARSLEYRADRFAADLCGDPEPLIKALRKLDASARRLRSRTAAASPALTSLFMVDPDPGSWLSAVMSTHPPVERRIRRLEALRSMERPGHTRRPT